tara:strand:+ start:2293 stop:2634 length:342 start_codon:yes stop_codon:yes gene_type:complete
MANENLKFIVVVWENTPTTEEKSYQDEDGNTVTETVEVDPFTITEYKEYTELDEAKSYYDSLDLSNGGAYINFDCNVCGMETYRHSDRSLPADHEAKCEAKIEEACNASENGE